MWVTGSCTSGDSQPGHWAIHRVWTRKPGVFSSEVRSLRRVFYRETWEVEESDEQEKEVPAKVGEVWVDDS